MLDKADILAFLARDHAAVSAAKRDYWAQRNRASAGQDTVCAGHALLAHARALAPEALGPRERALDLAHHVDQKALIDRVSARLARR